MTLWNRLEQYFKHKQLRFLQSFIGLDPVRPEQVDWNRIRKILVVRQHDQLGDFLLSTPVFKALKQKFPRAELAVVARSYTAPLLENHQYVDRIILLCENGRDWTWRTLSAFIKNIRSGYDLAIVLNTVSHSLTSDLIARFSGARYVLGPDHHLFAGTDRNFFYNLLAPYQDSPRSQSEKNLDILRYIGIDAADAREYITLSEQELRWATEHLRRLGWDERKPLIAIHPGAGKMPNRWPVENFAYVANRLVQKYSAQIYVTWGPAEEALGRALIKQLPAPTLSSTFSHIRRVAAVLARTDLLLCNDTGIMHVGAAVGTPLVAIFGPTDPREWKPVGDEFVALRGRDKTVQSVRPDDVLSEAERLLSSKTLRKKSKS